MSKIMMRLILQTVISACAIILACFASAAAEVRIGETGYLRSDKVSEIFVFKSSDAMSRVNELLKAGADASLLEQYIACFVPTNTKVLVITGEITSAFMSGADHTSDVMIITGPMAGCKGVVANIFVQN